MNPASLSLSFAVDQDQACGTLEAVLAIARRGGVTLARMDYADIGKHARASVRLTSEEPDRLDLFLTRLHNVIGISQVICENTVPASLTHSMPLELAPA